MGIDIQEIYNIYNGLLDNIIYESKIKQWNMKNAEIIVTGGGGLSFIDIIKQKYPQAILSNNPIFDNYNGLSIIAREYES